MNIASRDFEWAEWFEAVGFIHGMIPALPVVGNHEYFDCLRDADGAALNTLSALWRPQLGHDHAYGRGTLHSSSGGAAPRASRRASTVFVTSSAGAKMYDIRDEGWDGFAGTGIELERLAENTPFFQVVEAGREALLYEAYTATGERYDAFRIEKPASGPKRIVALETDIAERTFENTGEYRSDRLDAVPERAPSPR